MPHSLVEPEDVTGYGQIEGCSIDCSVGGLGVFLVRADVEGREVGFVVGRGMDQGLDIDVEELRVGMLGTFEEELALRIDTDSLSIC